jgi:hypothetical protein
MKGLRGGVPLVLFFVELMRAAKMTDEIPLCGLALAVIPTL